MNANRNHSGTKFDYEPHTSSETTFRRSNNAEKAVKSFAARTLLGAATMAESETEKKYIAHKETLRAEDFETLTSRPVLLYRYLCIFFDPRRCVGFPDNLFIRSLTFYAALTRRSFLLRLLL